MLTPLAPDLFVHRVPQSFYGVQMGTRMTVLRFGDALLLHSPVAATPELRAAVEALGTVRWVVAPNRFHHLYCDQWVGDGVTLLGPKSLQAKRPDLAFDGWIGEAPLPDGLDVLPLSSLPFVSETVWLHRPSRTLILSDLVYNTGMDSPWATRAVLRALGAGPGLRTTLLERLLTRREEGRQDLQTILSWEFDRLVPGHGAVIDDNPHGQLRHAHRWLLGPD
jgi:hypothetical protein